MDKHVGLCRTLTSMSAAAALTGEGSAPAATLATAGHTFGGDNWGSRCCWHPGVDPRMWLNLLPCTAPTTTANKELSTTQLDAADAGTLDLLDGPMAEGTCGPMAEAIRGVGCGLFGGPEAGGNNRVREKLGRCPPGDGTASVSPVPHPSSNTDGSSRKQVLLLCERRPHMPPRVPLHPWLQQCPQSRVLCLRCICRFLGASRWLSYFCCRGDIAACQHSQTRVDSPSHPWTCDGF